MREKLTELLSREKLKNTLHIILEFLFNPPLLICLGIAWLITNGWSYIVFTLGVYFDVPLMIGIASAYLAFLWVPFTPEKIITVIIAIALLKRFFPDDERTLKKLQNLHAKYKVKAHNAKENAKTTMQEHREHRTSTCSSKKTSVE